MWWRTRSSSPCSRQGATQTGPRPLSYELARQPSTWRRGWQRHEMSRIRSMRSTSRPQTSS
eukprot:16411848-Heterocapsa_arctica.AAC.1